jgi:biopolymer transport protein TolR
MAGGMELGASSKGGKKALDAAINTVPFIDLMAVTIAFLIMTAVWTQVGRLQVDQSGGVDDPATQEPPRTLPVALLITEKELKLTYGTETFDAYPIVRIDKGRIDLSALVAKLQAIKASNAEQSAITLQTEDAVRYEDHVRIIDGCIGAGMPSVSVSPAMG